MAGKRKRRDERFLVLTWRQRGQTWILNRATVTHSLGKARQLSTISQRYYNLRTSIVAEQLLDGIGELREPLSRTELRRRTLKDNLAKLEVTTQPQ